MTCGLSAKTTFNKEPLSWKGNERLFIMIRRVVVQTPTQVSTNEDVNDVETEVARRNAARRTISQRVDQEMRRISSPERTRCGLLGCFPRRVATRSTSNKREPSSIEKRVFGLAVKATPAEAKLTDVISQLQTMIAEQEAKVQRARALALAAYKAKQNKEALQALKRVKQFEKQLEGLHGQLVMVERQRDSLEESQMQKKLVAALSQSAKVMKANGPLVKKAEEVADVAVEFFDQNEDIANALSQVNEEGDDDDLLAELAEMTAIDEAVVAPTDVAVQELPVPTSTPLSASFPNVPKSLEHASLLSAA